MKKKENISNQVPGMPKETPFGVPDGYFDSFSDRLQQRISGREGHAKKSVIRRLKPQIAWVTSIAAVVIIGFSAYKFLIPHPKPVQLSKAAISSYLQEQAYSLDDNTLIDEDETLDEVPVTKTKSTAEDQKAYKDEIVHYLLQEDVDDSQITDKL